MAVQVVSVTWSRLEGSTSVRAKSGLVQTAFLARWAHCRDTSRSGMSGVALRWFGGVEARDDIAQRLLRVADREPACLMPFVCATPARRFLIAIFLPLYLDVARGDAKICGFEMDESQHREFAEAVNECKGIR